MSRMRRKLTSRVKLYAVMGMRLTLFSAFATICAAHTVAGDATNRTVPCGLFSDLQVQSTVPNNYQHQRTFPQIMQSRYQDLQQTVNGYESTGVELVRFDPEKAKYLPGGFSDEPGFYYYVPWLYRQLHVSLRAAVSMFLCANLAFAFLLGGWGLAQILTDWRSRAFAFLVSGCLLTAVWQLGDVYLFECAVPFATIPWLLCFAHQRAVTWSQAFVLASAGLLIGVAAEVRMVAVLPTLAFAIILLLAGPPGTYSVKALGLLAMLGGALGPVQVLQHALVARDSFFLDRAGTETENLERHTLGQFAYIGLGFLSNRFVPGGLCDQAGIARADELAPKAVYLSAEYDKALRREVGSIVAQNPLLVFFTLSAKLGIVLMVFAAFANIGLPAAILYPKPWFVELAFGIALAAASAPLLLLAPLPHYLVGVLSIAALYNIVSVDRALRKLHEKTLVTSALRERILLTAQAERLLADSAR